MGIAVYVGFAIASGAGAGGCALVTGATPAIASAQATTVFNKRFDMDSSK
jgi:hypothetical protein